MVKLPRVNADRALRALERDGWYQVHQSGAHLKLRHPTKPGYVEVTRHPGDLKTKTLSRIVKQAGLTYDEFAALL